MSTKHSPKNLPQANFTVRDRDRRSKATQLSFSTLTPQAGVSLEALRPQTRSKHLCASISSSGTTRVGKMKEFVKHSTRIILHSQTRVEHRGEDKGKQQWGQPPTPARARRQPWASALRRQVASRCGQDSAHARTAGWGRPKRAAPRAAYTWRRQPLGQTPPSAPAQASPRLVGGPRSQAGGTVTYDRGPFGPFGFWLLF